MQLNLAVCDDDRRDLDRLANTLQSYYIARNIELNITVFESGRELLQTYHRAGDYHILLLDVEMPELSGIQLAEIIRQTIDKYVIIVFVSNYPKYMQSSFHVHPFYYLTKPYTLQDVYTLMDDMIKEIEESHVIYTLLSTEEGDLTINMQEVLYIETTDSKNNILKFHLDNKTLTCRGTLTYWKEQLNDYHFYQCYRSILVNLVHIYCFDRHDLVLANRERIPISRAKEKELRNLYLNHAVELVNHTR